MVCVYQSCVWCVFSGHQDLESIGDLVAQVSDLKAAQASALAKVSDLEAAQVSATAKVLAVTSEVAALKAKVTTDASSPTSNVEWVQTHVQQDGGEWQLMVNLEKKILQDTTMNSTRFFKVQVPRRKAKRKQAPVCTSSAS